MGPCNPKFVLSTCYIVFILMPGRQIPAICNNMQWSVVWFVITWVMSLQHLMIWCHILPGHHPLWLRVEARGEEWDFGGYCNRPVIILSTRDKSISLRLPSLTLVDLPSLRFPSVSLFQPPYRCCNNTGWINLRVLKVSHSLPCSFAFVQFVTLTLVIMFGQMWQILIISSNITGTIQDNID